MKGVVITTSEYTKDFLKPCLDSIKDTAYTVLVVSNGGYKPDFEIKNLIINSWNGWEFAGIQRGKEVFSEFVHIMDTTIIKDITLFDKLFALKGNVVLTKGNFHYMGKFVTKELPNLPRVQDKTLAIYLECRWLDGFNFTEFTPDLPVHSNNWIEIHGQKRMVIENEYMIKYKGTAWVSPDQKKEIEDEIIKRSGQEAKDKL